MKLALRIEVATLRGTRRGVPRLLALLREHHAHATFLFNVGPDRTGRAPGLLPRVPLWRCYGPLALVSGTLVPAPDLGPRCRDEMRSVRPEGHEAGILAYDRVTWMRRVERAAEPWTRAAMQRARERFEEVFGTPALVHGAPGWRMNRFAFRLTQRLAFRYGSDTRGAGPFIPVVRGEIAPCPQLPTTLPTLDELFGSGLNAEEAVRRLLELARKPPPSGHVYTLRAEIEGGPFEPALRALFAGWRALGLELVALRDYAAGLDIAHLPRRVVIEEAQPGAPHPVAVAGKEFLT